MALMANRPNHRYASGGIRVLRVTSRAWSICKPSSPHFVVGTCGRTLPSAREPPTMARSLKTWRPAWWRRCSAHATHAGDGKLVSWCTNNW
eukprot:350975-Chlamydomonas_euryale.AAC.5